MKLSTTLLWAMIVSSVTLTSCFNHLKTPSSSLDATLTLQSPSTPCDKGGLSQLLASKVISLLSVLSSQPKQLCALPPFMLTDLLTKLSCSPPLLKILPKNVLRDFVISVGQKDLSLLTSLPSNVLNPLIQTTNGGVQPGLFSLPKPSFPPFIPGLLDIFAKPSLPGLPCGGVPTKPFSLPIPSIPVAKPSIPNQLPCISSKPTIPLCKQFIPLKPTLPEPPRVPAPDPCVSPSIPAPLPPPAVPELPTPVTPLSSYTDSPTSPAITDLPTTPAITGLPTPPLVPNSPQPPPGTESPSLPSPPVSPASPPVPDLTPALPSTNLPPPPLPTNLPLPTYLPPQPSTGVTDVSPTTPNSDSPPTTTPSEIVTNPPTYNPSPYRTPSLIKKIVNKKLEVIDKVKKILCDITNASEKGENSNVSAGTIINNRPTIHVSAKDPNSKVFILVPVPSLKKIPSLTIPDVLTPIKSFDPNFFKNKISEVMLQLKKPISIIEEKPDIKKKLFPTIPCQVPCP